MRLKTNVRGSFETCCFLALYNRYGCWGKISQFQCNLSTRGSTSYLGWAHELQSDQCLWRRTFPSFRGTFSAKWRRSTHVTSIMYNFIFLVITAWWIWWGSMHGICLHGSHGVCSLFCMLSFVSLEPTFMNHEQISSLASPICQEGAKRKNLPNFPLFPDFPWFFLIFPLFFLIFGIFFFCCQGGTLSPLAPQWLCHWNKYCH